MIIKSKFKNYEVAIEENLFFLSSLIKLENTQYVIDKNVFDLYSDYFQEIPKNRLMIIEALEEHKIIDTALDICEKMTEIPAKRNATLVSIGGGSFKISRDLLQISYTEVFIGSLFQQHF